MLITLNKPASWRINTENERDLLCCCSSYLAYNGLWRQVTHAFNLGPLNKKLSIASAALPAGFCPVLSVSYQKGRERKQGWSWWRWGWRGNERGGGGGTFREKACCVCLRHNEWTHRSNFKEEVVWAHNRPGCWTTASDQEFPHPNWHSHLNLWNTVKLQALVSNVLFKLNNDYSSAFITATAPSLFLRTIGHWFTDSNQSVINYRLSQNGQIIQLEGHIWQIKLVNVVSFLCTYGCSFYLTRTIKIPLSV